jgi:hypothetical protein
VRSIRTISTGLLVLLVATIVLFWNEGRSLRQARALAEGEAVVKTVVTAAIDPQNEGRLVHLAGETSGGQKLHDHDLGIEVAGLRLMRRVEMFQWKEEHASRSGRGSGETEADFTYSRTWSEEPIDWTRFRFPQDHKNPPMPAITSRSFVAKDARIGAFRIDERIITMLGHGAAFNVPAGATGLAHDRLGRPTQAVQGGIFAGDDPAAPRVGDVRISYTVLSHQSVSLAGRQNGDGIVPFRTANGNEILLAQTGMHDAAEMFDFAEGANTAMTWILRLFGAALICLGWRVVLRPLQMIASYVPIADALAAFGVGVAALLATLVTAPLVIGIAWLFYRPLNAIVIIAIGGGLGCLGFAYLRKGAVSRPAAPG